MKMIQRLQVKNVLLFLLVLFLLTGVTGCGNQKKSEQDEVFSEDATDNDLNIIVTVFPVYDWILNILGEKPANAEVSLLYDNGVDPHSYQPTANDIAEISSCDVFFYVGGESDQWVKEILQNTVNKDRITVNLMEELGDALINEENIETEEQDTEEEEDKHHQDPEYDEHIWLSLKNAELLCDSIELALETADPEHTEVYRTNADNYKDKLSTLDHDYETTVRTADLNTLLFADRFPFIYLIRDYDLEYYAAFNGCSAETEASFETIIFLAEKVDELGLQRLIVIDGSDGKIAETIIQNTKEKDQKILTLDSLQSCSSESIRVGKTYCSVMENNLEILKEALNND